LQVEKKTIITVSLIAVAGGIVLYLVLSAVNNANDVFTGSYNKPRLADIKQMCNDKLVEMGYPEPTEMMINMCAGTVVNGLAETRP
jgi:hypothetical protein